jgi:DNA-directed RNA polymerase subunit H (RpoH/RPB5)
MSSNRVQIIYNSRFHLLSILDEIGYSVESYENFSINEIDGRIKTQQLDMLLHEKLSEEPIDGAKKRKKVLVKYLCGDKAPIKNINSKTLESLVEETFVFENTLDKSDTLILIVDDDLNDSIREKLKYLYDHDGYFVVVHNISRLQFNILKHERVPKSWVASETEVDEVMKRYNLTSRKEFPEIGRFDPVALALCLRPNQICSIERKSPTAGTQMFYRVCV